MTRPTQRFTNSDVPYAWANGQSARTATYWTDGTNLYSYDVIIGVTEGERKVLLEYTAHGTFVSTTTSKHVGYARPYASETRKPNPTTGGN